MASSLAPPSPAREGAPSSLLLHVNDTTITCVCPPDTPRLAKDLSFFADDQERGISWVHLPCRPVHTLERIGAAGQDHGALTGLLGPNPSPAALRKVKNFTSKFICDGPCNGCEKELEDFFTCKRCLAWQHTECMLYGDKGDVGGPVCNHCYVDFLVHYDEVRQWQRRRLVEVVQEAYMFLTDVELVHEVWRRAWAQDFMRRFMYQNQGLFVRFVQQRRYQQMVAPYIFLPAAPAHEQPVEQDPVVNGDHIKQEPIDDDDDDNLVDMREAHINFEASLWENSNIVVANPFTKVATKQPHRTQRQLNRKPSPLRADGTKRSHHRKRPRTPEYAPGIRVFGPAAPGPRRAGVDPTKTHSMPTAATYINSDGDCPSAEPKSPRAERLSLASKKRAYRERRLSLASTKGEYRKRKRLESPSSSLEDEDSEYESRIPASPMHKGRKKNQPLGAGSARKSVRMSEAMKKPASKKKPHNELFMTEDEDSEGYGPGGGQGMNHDAQSSGQDDRSDGDDEEEEESPSPLPSPVLKGRKRSSLVGARAPRKSINMAEAMKRPATTAFSTDDSDAEKDGQGNEPMQKRVRFSTANDQQDQDVEELLSPTIKDTIEHDDDGVDDAGFTMQDQMANIEDEEDLSLQNIKSRGRRSAPSLAKRSICCKCRDGTRTRNGSFECSQCHNLQHRACAAPGQTGLRPACNSCLGPTQSKPAPAPVAVAERQTRTKQPAARPAKAAPARRQPRSRPKAAGRPAARSSGGAPVAQPQGRIDIAAAIRTGVNPPAALVVRRESQRDPPAVPSTAAAPPLPRTAAAGLQVAEAMIDEISTLSSTILWRAYLAIPSPNHDADTAAAAAAASPRRRRPPPDWLAECEKTLTQMMLEAGRDTTKGYLRAALSAFPRLPPPILDAMTEMALWMVGPDGPWRGKQAKLGLVGESLGIEPKGRHWRGGGGSSKQT